VKYFAREHALIGRSVPLGITGRVRRVRGMGVRASDLPAPIGSLVRLGEGAAFGEVVGFDDDETIVMLLSSTGVRVIDLMTPVGRGQRLGIFAGPGVGKSTLLGQIARGTDADVNVIALVGERGREVREFIEHALGPEGLARSVVVVSTGDEPPLMRIRASKLACAAAEHFRDRGRDVLLMMDSVTRFAHAQRQIGLSAGEPPATRGYTPSVFSARNVKRHAASIWSTRLSSIARRPASSARPGVDTADIAPASARLRMIRGIVQNSLHGQKGIASFS